MRALWILTLGLVALSAQGCKQKEPEPIPGPKAGGLAVPGGSRTPGIAWFQGSFDEAFARPQIPRNCKEYSLIAPRTSEPARTRKRANSPASEMCGTGNCPAAPANRPHRPLM